MFSLNLFPYLVFYVSKTSVWASLLNENYAKIHEMNFM